MKITESQLRNVVKRLIREQAMGVGPSDNPWLRGPDIEVDDNTLEQACEAAITTCENLRSEQFQNAYSYDKHVRSAIAPYLPTDKKEKYAFIGVLKSMLKKRANYDDWYDGAYAAARSVGGFHAWSTPGFADAYRASGERGDW